MIPKLLILGQHSAAISFQFINLSKYIFSNLLFCFAHILLTLTHLLHHLSQHVLQTVNFISHETAYIIQSPLFFGFDCFYVLCKFINPKQSFLSLANFEQGIFIEVVQFWYFCSQESSRLHLFLKLQSERLILGDQWLRLRLKFILLTFYFSLELQTFSFKQQNLLIKLIFLFVQLLTKINHLTYITFLCPFKLYLEILDHFIFFLYCDFIILDKLTVPIMLSLVCYPELLPKLLYFGLMVSNYVMQVYHLVVLLHFGTFEQEQTVKYYYRLLDY